MPRLKYYNYNTEQWENVVVGAQGDTGPGVPAGGTAGQIVSKINGTDFNTEWIDNYTSQVKHLVKAGEALTKGQAVYISSANGTNMIASKANNTTETTSSKTIGLVAQDLANNAEGFVITEGLLSGIDTHTATAGDPVWLGSNGALLFGASNKPVAPAHMVFLGIVTNAHNNGEIFVKVQNGFELDELHDVSITSPAAGDIVVRNSANTLWENQTLSEAGVSEVGHTHDDRYYTESETNTAISNAIAGLVDTAPATLDTLNELAAAINDDASFAATVTTALAGKSDTSHTHDDRYYTETETDNLLSAKANLSGASFTGEVSSTTRLIGTTPTDAGSTGGITIKAPSTGSQTSAYLQFVNNPANAQWGSIEANTAGAMTIGATQLNLPTKTYAPGSVVQVTRTRTSARSAYGYSSDTIISDLNVVIYPKFANSLLLVQWSVNYECDYNSVFRVYRDGGLVYTSGYQGYNENDGNQWSGVASTQYDTDVASTPSNQMIQYFVPAGSTAGTTLQLAVRTTSSQSATFYLNRSVNSSGSGAYEVGVSNVVCWEIAQ